MTALPLQTISFACRHCPATFASLTALLAHVADAHGRAPGDREPERLTTAQWRKRGAGEPATRGRPRINVGPCDRPGCEGRVVGLGLCRKHYQFEYRRRGLAVPERGQP